VSFPQSSRQTHQRVVLYALDGYLILVVPELWIFGVKLFQTHFLRLKGFKGRTQGLTLNYLE
jgi:hypothetical protein